MFAGVTGLRLALHRGSGLDLGPRAAAEAACYLAYAASYVVLLATELWAGPPEWSETMRFVGLAQAWAAGSLHIAMLQRLRADEQRHQLIQAELQVVKDLYEAEHGDGVV